MALEKNIKFWKCLLVTVQIIAFVTDAVAYMQLKPMKIGSGNCIDDHWQSHPIQSTWFDDAKCERYKCIFMNDILYVRVHGCGAVGILPECRLITESGNYPKCCPKPVCPELPYDYGENEK